MEVDSRIKLMTTFEADLNVYSNHLKMFTEGALEMLDNQQLLADSIWILYENSAMKYYVRELKASLSQDLLRIRDKLKTQHNLIAAYC